jgi:glucose-1-phosphate thymidylyltransferase
MKGIILAGGTGSRLHPITLGVSKQLLPIYDKPMIYYPISVLMLADIREILIITTPDDLNSFKNLLSDGSQFGLDITYKIQPNPGGLAEAFILGEDFIKNDSVCLVLGDNIFYGQNFTPKLKNAIKNAEEKNCATIFGYQVKDPQRYGVIEFDKSGKVLSIQEKPKTPKSDYAATGLYFYDNSVITKAKKIKKSKRGELEITSINKKYLQDKKLNMEMLGRGFAWLDTGTNESLLEASQFVETIQKRQGYKIACLEEIAIDKNWIDSNNIQISNKSEYGKYVHSILK